LSNSKIIELAYTSDQDRENVESEEKRRRLVDWNADLLCRLLEKVVAHNQLSREGHRNSSHRRALHASNSKTPTGCSVGIDEVVQVIELPASRSASVHNLMDAGCNSTLDSTVVEQVRLYVKSIANLYPNNHFHNFEHVRVLRGNLCFIGMYSLCLTLLLEGVPCCFECVEDVVANGRRFRKRYM
jgi:hypothetical protein